MDHCRMNRNSCLRTAGSQNICRGGCRPAGAPMTRETPDPYSCLDGHLPAAMGYVPYQKWSTPFELARGLQMGTIFPDLCKPFCGKGGAVCR